MGLIGFRSLNLEWSLPSNDLRESSGGAKEVATYVLEQTMYRPTEFDDKAQVGLIE